MITEFNWFIQLFMRKRRYRTMKVNVVLKECNGETNLDWIMEKVKDVFFMMIMLK